MKRTLLLLLSIFTFSFAYGQGKLIVKNHPSAKVQPAMETPMGPAESLPLNNNIVFRDAEEAGETTYDLQSNSSLPSRIINHDGNILLSWTYGNTSPGAGVPERGTAFRMKNAAGEWSPEPTARIEPVRTGWPSTNVTSNGTITNLAHSVDYDLVFSTRALDGGDWDVNFIPTSTPNGALWPRSATGGPDGNSVHAIAVTTPTAFGGVEVGGIDGHLLYWRSQDEGATWDVQDFIIPGCDTTRYGLMTNDAYSISSHGNTVAVAVFTDWADLNVFISRDNGDTWESRRVLDHPLKKYTIDSGYTLDQLPEDPNRPDTLAVRSNDNTGMVFVDANEMVHLVYSPMYYMDADLLDGNFQYFPFSTGTIEYWNETMDNDVAVVVAGVEDMDGDTVLSEAITEANGYFESMASQASIGVDGNGRIHVVYNALNELNVNEAGQASMQVFHTYSDDGGMTWSEDIRNLTTECEETQPFAEFGYEFYYAKLASVVDDRLHVLVQADLQPGTAVQQTEIPIGEEANQMFYMSPPADPTVNNEEVLVEGINIFPNPANNAINVELGLDADLASVQIVDLLGKVVYSNTIQNASATKFHVINTEALGNGTYFVRITSENQKMIETLVIQH